MKKSKTMKKSKNSIIIKYEHNGFNKPISIDKVDTNTLDVALRVCDISLPLSILDKIIDVIELLECKGDKTTINDILKLKREWK